MGTATAGAMPAKNLGFEDWDANGQPEGWRVQASETYQVAPDCAGGRNGGCALRIEAKAGAGRDTFLPLAQPLGASPAAGHRLRLSGWIRTAEVIDGWAGLWMRADVEGKPMVLDNMQREGPRGTSGWKRYEIAVDVPANATLVSFGVLLSGKGGAWFDDLELAVDTSVQVGRAGKSQVIHPLRPAPSRNLATDRALTLATTEAPPVRPDWRAEARAAANPIRSLTSEDFSDLQFLKPLLAGKRVVQLGESAHGVAEFNWMKVRLVKFLHRELGFDVVAFEASLTGCDIADGRIGRSAPVDVMRDAIAPVWHSTETLGLFEYFEAERAAGRRLALAGFDVQGSGRAAPDVSRALVRQVGRIDPDLARRIETYEAQLRPGLAPETAAGMKMAYGAAADGLERERGALRTLESQRPEVVDLAIQELRSRMRFVEQLADASAVLGSPVRDAGMADNLDFVLDTLYPGRKVIVWAHNAHVARHAAGSRYERWMGRLVAERRGREVYTVGLYMGWGIGALNDRKLYEIRPAAEDSLEAILASAGWRMSFVDLGGTAASWVRAPLEAREWGARPINIRPGETYDALIYIDAVTPPEYL